MIRAIMSLLAAAVLLPVLTLGCTGRGVDENGGNNMPKAEIPAIDANPVVTATVTFAVG